MLYKKVQYRALCKQKVNCTWRALLHGLSWKVRLILRLCTYIATERALFFVDTILFATLQCFTRNFFSVFIALDSHENILPLYVSGYMSLSL